MREGQAGVEALEKVPKQPSAAAPLLACTGGSVCFGLVAYHADPCHCHSLQKATILLPGFMTACRCHCYLTEQFYPNTAAMAPTPRGTAPSSFEQTWDDTDAAFLNPTALPIAKVPRAWERKQETKVTGEGRHKKVWRRYSMRSRAANTATPDEDEEEEQERDSRSRAVKKLQHMSPKAMEKSATLRTGRKRTFKATRWDRRKSVLPRRRPSDTCSNGMLNSS